LPSGRQQGPGGAGGGWGPAGHSGTRRLASAPKSGLAVGLIGEDILVVRHGTKVVARLVIPSVKALGRWASRAGGSAPEAEVAKDLLDSVAVVDEGNHADGAWHSGQRSGSVCQACMIRSRHFLEGRRRGGGGEPVGRGFYPERGT